MPNCRFLFLILALLIVGIASGAPAPRVQDLQQGPVLLTGLEDTPFDGMTFPERPIPTTLDDPIVPVILVGMTWYDNQHNGSAGKQAAVDRDGYVHHVWTRGINATSTQRHVYYNVWDPFAEQFTLPDLTDPFGVAADAAPRAGYCNVAVNDEGFAFPAFHQGTTTHMTAAVGMDFFPRLGGFLTWAPATLAGNPELDWPKIAVDINGDVHVVVTESLDEENADGREFYAKGNVWINGQNDSLTWPGGWEPWTESWFITMDVDASPISDKIAVVWLSNPDVWGDAENNDNVYTDVWLRTSDDAGVTWNDAINVTSFANPDTNCVNMGGDPNVCNGDTMRPWLDVHVLIDHHDIVHLAFTCSGWFWWDYDGTPLHPNHGYIWSNLWHWDSYRQEFNMIHEAWFGHSSVSLGSNNTMCHRPNLAVDTTTGYMYCSFQKFDSVQVSAGGYPSGDAWITVSTDSGRTWAEATNVSNTDGGVGTAADSCKSERDISLAKFVTNGIVHMQYMMDRDNGTSITDTPEGVPTNNPMYYLRIPTTLIPTAPIVNPLRNLRADSTGFPWDILATEERPNLTPDRFTLYQNYPNPFNPSTNIQFDLPTESVVSLRVFDVQGREVTRLLDKARLTGGAHIASFDATDFASGVYFYRLETPNASETKKMILLK